MNIEVRQLGASDAQAFSALRRLVTADNPVPMGLSLDEELSRPIQGFRDQLSSPALNAAFRALDGLLLAPRPPGESNVSTLIGTNIAKIQKGLMRTSGLCFVMVGDTWIEHVTPAV